MKSVTESDVLISLKKCKVDAQCPEVMKVMDDLFEPEWLDLTQRLTWKWYQANGPRDKGHWMLGSIDADRKDMVLLAANGPVFNKTGTREYALNGWKYRIVIVDTHVSRQSWKLLKQRGRDV